MTRALAALHDTTYGGVYYSANVDFTNALVQPIWAKLATTGLANLLVKVMQVDALDPYNKIYVQLDNDDVYRWNGTSWTKVIDLATARTLSGLVGGVAGYISANKTIAGRVYFPMSLGPDVSGSTRVLVSTDYGATWTSRTVKDYALTTTPAYVSAAGDHIWCCYGDLYHALQYSDDNGATWKGLYQIWATSGGGSQINIDPLDGTRVYFSQSATDKDLMRYYYYGAYAGDELQSGKNLAEIYLSTSPVTAGDHWFSPVTSGKQRILYFSGSVARLYATTDSWANIAEATPTNWGTTIDPPSAIHAARENETYLLIGTTGTKHVFAWVGEATSALPWNVSGTNWNTSPFTNAIPNSGYIAVYGIFAGEAEAAAGVYVYADEEGDINNIPSYDGLGRPMFGDRSSWRDRPTDGFDIYHAEDVQRSAPQIHAPWSSGTPPGVGVGIVSDGSKWVYSDAPILTTADTGILDYADGNVTNPPTQSELYTALGDPAALGAGKAYLLNDNGDGLREYLVVSDGADWWFVPLAKAAGTVTPDATATNAASYLTTPTYDGSGQATHPDVYDSVTGWNGKRYWMAMSPYPSSNAAYENPSILCSDDGTTWTVPAGLTNPIDPQPAGRYNSDPDIIVDGSSVMWCFYREVITGSNDFVRVRSSADGVTWNAEAALVTGSYGTLLSPAVIYDGAQYVMYVIDYTTSPNTLKRRTCATPNGVWSAATTLTVNNLPAGKDLWHIDVIKNGADYHAFVVVCNLGQTGVGSVLYFAQSADGLTWTIDNSVLLAPVPGAWDDERIYRASGTVIVGGYDLWYSAYNTAVIWHIGRTTVTV